eukprot:748066-Hanusia_phi.AAC.2
MGSMAVSGRISVGCRRCDHEDAGRRMCSMAHGMAMAWEDIKDPGENENQRCEVERSVIWWKRKGIDEGDERMAPMILCWRSGSNNFQTGKHGVRIQGKGAR